MDASTSALARITRFVRAVSDRAPPVHEALPALRRLLEAAGVEYRLVGGVAVVHHGYVRATDDLDVLVEPGALERVRPLLAEHGFAELGSARLRHVETAVVVDLLVSGTAMPRTGSGDYPAVEAVGRSPRDAAVADLGGLIALKLRAARHQDLADVVALVKALDEVAFTSLEASVAPALRPALRDLRRDALEELRWER